MKMWLNDNPISVAIAAKGERNNKNYETPRFSFLSHRCGYLVGRKDVDYKRPRLFFIDIVQTTKTQCLCQKTMALT